MRREDTVVTDMPSWGEEPTNVNGEPAHLRAVPPAPPRPRFVEKSKVVTMERLAMAHQEEQARRAKSAAPPPMPLQPEALPEGAGKIIVMFGCRGGAGSTTLAVNLGATLARQGKKVCVLDLDLQLGDVFVALDLETNTSIASLAREAGMLDGAALRRRLQRHDSGVYALSQTGRLDDVDPQLPERMPGLLAMLCAEFDYVLVDGVRDFGDHALAALDMADSIAIVVTQDVPAVRRATRVTKLMRQLGYSDRKMRLVVNRHDRKAPVGLLEIERTLSMPATSVVRNDYRRVRAAGDEGALVHDIARGSGIDADLEDLGRTMGGVTPTVADAPGFFGRLFGKGGR